MTVDAIPTSSRSAAFWVGARASIPIIIASAPFGVLFGALAVENGFTIFEAVLMSATIYGGSAQMVGIELFGKNIAPWVVVMSIFVVNSRHFLYSAAVGRHISHWPWIPQAVAFFFLVDPQFAEIERKAESGRFITFAWYLGMALPIYAFWIVDTLIGAVFGGVVSDAHALGIDFLLPIYFLGMVMEFRDRPRWLPIVAVSAVASIVAYKTVGSPWHVSLGALAGIVLAVAMKPLPEAQKP